MENNQFVISFYFKDARVTGKVKWFNVKIKYGFIHWYMFIL